METSESKDRKPRNPVLPDTWQVIENTFSDGTSDFQVFTSEMGQEVRLALIEPTQDQAEKVADYLNEHIAWHAARDIT